MRKGTLTIVDSDESYLWEEDAEDAQLDIEVTPYIERKLAKYGCGWKYLPDIDYWLLVGPVEVLSDGTGGMGSTGTRAGPSGTRVLGRACGMLKRKEADMTAQELLKRYKAGELLFKNADLRGVDLSYQDLHRICLYGADLIGAKVVNTNLQGADLRYARCDGADLHYANLDDSIREGWTTEGANLWSIFP